MRRWRMFLWSCRSGRDERRRGSPVLPFAWSPPKGERVSVGDAQTTLSRCFQSFMGGPRLVSCCRRSDRKLDTPRQVHQTRLKIAKEDPSQLANCLTIIVPAQHLLEWSRRAQLLTAGMPQSLACRVQQPRNAIIHVQRALALLRGGSVQLLPQSLIFVALRVAQQPRTAPVHGMVADDEIREPCVALSNRRPFHLQRSRLVADRDVQQILVPWRVCTTRWSIHSHSVF